jgi:1-acyl-sn-glycerol-3-phosphate acyltransferase
MKADRRQTTKWLYGMPLFSGLVYRFSAFVVRVLMATLWRARLRNLDTLPKDEPFLLLSNHSSMLDPFWVGVPVPRGVRAMASSSLLSIPVLGAYLKMCGCFPKMKYTRDKDAMETLQRFFEEGYAILIFPEGNRSWNGETGQIGPGIGRLIKRLQCKVVYARLNSAYLVKPRWAMHARSVPIEVEYDGPYSYEEGMSVEAITAEVQEKITVIPHLKEPARVRGRKMAAGLPQYLWACPHCFALEALKLQKRNKNAVRCEACSSEWEIDVFCMLRGQTELSVADAFRVIEAHFSVPPIAEKAVFDSTGVALEATDGKLFFVPRGKQKPECVAEGRIQLHRDGVRVVQEDAVIWSAGYQEIRGISVEFGNMLHFRIGEKLMRLRIDDHSPLKWDHFLRRWRLHVVGTEY